MTDRADATAAAHQALTRALRCNGEKAVGVLLDAIKRCDCHRTQVQMKAAIDLIREAHALTAETMGEYRARGGV